MLTNRVAALMAQHHAPGGRGRRRQVPIEEVQPHDLRRKSLIMKVHLYLTLKTLKKQQKRKSLIMKVRLY